MQHMQSFDNQFLHVNCSMEQKLLETECTLLEAIIMVDT